MLSLLIVSLWLSPPQDQAERLYDNAITFMNAGKYKEALADFETIVTSYPQTPWASRTLLKLSTYYLEVEKDPTRALTYLNTLQNSHASAPEAPAAYYYKALITWRQAGSQAELESASADLTRMLNLFPHNPWRGDALLLMAKVAMTLGDYKQSLSYFQRLEFNEPNSQHLPEAWLLSAQVAVLGDFADQAPLILSRLQSRFPNSAEAQLASAWLRLLTRFGSGGNGAYALDKAFFGATPKTFNAPQMLLVDGGESLAVANDRSLRLLPLSTTGKAREVTVAELKRLGRGPRGELLMVFDNRVTSEDGSLSFKSLALNGSPLRDIKHAAMDALGRLFVIDGDARDVLPFDRNGSALRPLGQAKAKQVACYANEAVVLTADGGTLRRFDRNLQPQGTYSFKNVEDLCFDDFGNLYLLHEKGSAVTVIDRGGKQLASINLKNGAYPLKQAEALAVDASGAIYLADRRAGAVFRFL